MGSSLVFLWFSQACDLVGLCVCLLFIFLCSFLLFILSYFCVLELVFLCYIIFYYYPLEAHLFSNERKKGSDLDRRRGREILGGVEEAETIVRI